MDLGSTNKTYLNVSYSSQFYFIFLCWVVLVTWSNLFFCTRRKLLLNLNDTMNYLKKTLLSLAIAGRALINTWFLSCIYHNVLLSTLYFDYCYKDWQLSYCTTYFSTFLSLKLSYVLFNRTHLIFFSYLETCLRTMVCLYFQKM